MVKALRASGKPQDLAEELARTVAAERSTTRRIPIIEALLDIGDAQHAGEMAREVIANQTVFGGDLARMVRVLILSEGLQAADSIVALLRARQERLEDKHILKVKAKHLLEIADSLASLGALATSTQLWLELLTSLAAPIVESFASCSSLVQSGQRTLAITTLRNKLNDEKLPAADRARLGALLSSAELRSPLETTAASAPGSC